jgi:redox-sensitive bicupin YhaK (pirin superfamily)
MILPRRSADRGYFDHGWLKTWHTFSFADYVDPKEMGYGPLRVINQDIVAPGVGFPMHAHRDMEILTWVLQGAVAHRDSLGNDSVIRPGEAQRMRAGRGITHSEMNPSDSEATHLLQIWLRPDRRGLEPGYAQVAFAPECLRDRLCLIAAPEGAAGSVDLHQDARVYVARLAVGAEVTHDLAPGRIAYLHVAGGGLEVNGLALGPGDGARIADEPRLALRATQAGELVLFDMANIL